METPTPFCDLNLKEGWSGDVLCLGEDEARTLERAKIEAETKTKEIARDFELAFRLVRQENDRLVEDYKRLKLQLKLCESHAAAMAKDFDASLLVVQQERDKLKSKLGMANKTLLDYADPKDSGKMTHYHAQATLEKIIKI